MVTPQEDHEQQNQQDLGDTAQEDQEFLQAPAVLDEEGAGEDVECQGGPPAQDQEQVEETQDQEDEVPGARQLSEVEVAVQLAERQRRLHEEIQERETSMARALGSP